MAITHGFVSGKNDGPDGTLVQPSNWNADHTVTSDAVTVSGTSHTVAASDAGETLRCTSGSATTVTVDNLTVGQWLNVLAAGAGTVTVAAGAGWTVVSRGSVFESAGQWAVMTVYCDATDHAVLSGDIT